MKNIYIQGKGLRISLVEKQTNALYRPNAQYKSESFQYLLIKNLFESPFLPILLKEWFFLVKPHGYLILTYTVHGGIKPELIEKMVWWLFRGTYSIREHGNGICVIQKNCSVLVRGDSMNKWTFGIVTNGERDDWIEQIITSIRRQRIPQCEIIICGKYRDRKEPDISYIEFTDRSDRGWITKKKNLICEKARYENLCILHDRLILDPGWYDGMKRYGNAFELLGCRQKDKTTGEQTGDWLTLGGPMNNFYCKISRLEYTDWDRYVYLSGQLTILKKSIWQKVLWDETRYWNEGEDADISFRARDIGHLIRFNPMSSCTALSWRHGKLPLKYNIHQGLVPKDMLLRRMMRITARTVASIPVVREIMFYSYRWILKSPIYQYIIYH